LSRNLASRLIVAAIGIPAIISIALLGGYILLGFVILLTALGGSELSSIFGQKGLRSSLFFSAFLPCLCVLFSFYNVPIEFGISLALLLAACLAAAGYIRTEKEQSADFPGRFFAYILPVIYLGLSGSFVVKLGALPAGGRILTYLFLMVWATDSAAYLGGRTLGRHKLAPALSPGKTVEGFIAGFAGALLAGVVSGSLFLDLGWPQIIVVSVIGCFFAQAGDLFESGLKRFGGVKDSSSIIPGHGGVLDRFDSFLFAAPAAYLIMAFWR